MDVASSAPGSARWLWVLWAATVLVGLSLAAAMKLCADVARMEFERNGITALPNGTVIACAAGSFLWVAVLPLAAAGVWATRRGWRASLVWSLATAMTMILAAALITSGLALPFQPIGG